MRQALILIVLVVLLAPIGARAQESEPPRPDPPAPLPSGAPHPLSAETVYFWSHPAGRAFLAVVELNNRGDQSLGGIVTRWDAYDATGALLGSHARLQPVLGPGERFAYVAGAGPANLSGSPMRVIVSLVEAGRPVIAPYPFLGIDDVRILRQASSTTEGMTDYLVTLTATTGAEPVGRRDLIVDVVLRDESGAVVGAIFSAVFTSLPDRIPPHTAFPVEVRVPVPGGTPTQADIAAYSRPTLRP
jgi:hypothetical protein